MQDFFNIEVPFPKPVGTWQISDKKDFPFSSIGLPGFKEGRGSVARAGKTAGSASGSEGVMAQAAGEKPFKSGLHSYSFSLYIYTSAAEPQAALSIWRKEERQR
jgi:hypothetical protein